MRRNWGKTELLGRDTLRGGESIDHSVAVHCVGAGRTFIDRCCLDHAAHLIGGECRINVQLSILSRSSFPLRMITDFAPAALALRVFSAKATCKPRRITAIFPATLAGNSSGLP